VLASFLLATIFGAQTPTWSSLEEPYRYQHLDFSQVHETPLPSGGRLFSFPSPSGDTVYGTLVEPSGARNAPCAILLHGLGESKNGMIQRFGTALLAKGIAYAAIDAPGHGERATPADKKIQQEIGTVFLTTPEKGDLLRSIVHSPYRDDLVGYLSRAVIGGIIDNRHVLDYVTSRKEIDHHHIFLVGNSMGSIMSAILGSFDSRPAGAVLLVGGDPVLPLLAQLSESEQKLALITCCSYYAPKWTHPVQMLNGTKDTVMPRAAADRLFNAFPEKWRGISWYNSDHFLPGLATEETAGWIAMRSALANGGQAKVTGRERISRAQPSLDVLGFPAVRLSFQLH